MGRKEDRKLKKLHGEKLGKNRSSMDMDIGPLKVGDELAIPVHVDNAKGPISDLPGSLTPEEFMGVTHHLSDKELNRIIYNNAKMAVREGFMPEKPKDDFGTVMWFAWNFITDEMREAFPAIAREYLTHYQVMNDDVSDIDEVVRTGSGLKFENIPYPRMQEKTWDDAYYFRVLLMMLYSARGGSVYSKNFLISLYKVYYKYEYNKVKKLDILTYLDILECHDEYCRRQGYPSGHTMDGSISFKDMVIEQRKHEPGWTNAYGERALSPAPGKHGKDGLNSDILNKAAAEIRDITDSPDEPPIQPSASRLLIMAELMGIRIDETCNEQAVHMNVLADSMNKVIFLNSPEYRKIRQELAERCKGVLRVNYPEMFDPYEYQTNERYIGLEVAECIMSDVFKKYDANYRMPYDSKKFSLPDLMADLTITLEKDFPGVRMTFDEVQILSMVQYLSECLCELMAVRDTELDEVLRISRRKGEGEWSKEQATDEKTTEKVLRSVESLRGKEPEVAEKVEEIPLDEEGLREEVENLRQRLSEREAALAEAEQKVIRQRVLYEKARDEREELEEKVTEAAVEHTELIALREFVYGLKKEESEEDLDEDTKYQILEKIKDKKVAVLGGTERWIKRMKRLLPNWSFVGVEDDSLGGFNALERADVIYIYTNALQHKQYYRAMSLIEKKRKMLYYLGSSNVDECLRQFGKEVGRG